MSLAINLRISWQQRQIDGHSKRRIQVTPGLNLNFCIPVIVLNDTEGFIYFGGGNKLCSVQIVGNLLISELGLGTMSPYLPTCFLGSHQHLASTITTCEYGNFQKAGISWRP